MEHQEFYKAILDLLDLSSLVTIACSYFHITTEEAALHQVEITRDIGRLMVKWVESHELTTMLDENSEYDYYPIAVSELEELKKGGTAGAG